MKHEKVAEGHMFGIYDSRGGSFFYAGSRKEAAKKWIEEMIIEKEDEERFLEETYIGPKSLYIPTDWELQDGEDVLYGREATSYIGGHGEVFIVPRGGENDPPDVIDIEIDMGWGTPFKTKALWCDYGEDACGMIVKLK